MNLDIIKEEEKNLLEVINIIEERIKKAEESFDAQKHFIIGFKEGMRGTQFNRQALMSMYSTEINSLRSNLKSPYFGKVEYKATNQNKEQIYIGKRAIVDDSANVLVYDWRSPICSVYYDYSIGPCEYINDGVKIKGELLLKRQFDIKNGKLINVDELDSLNNDEVLLKYLSENNDARLKSIIATIQSEQNKIIRSPLSNDYIIQGVAGSGKTTVALHRVAYLLYNEAKRINENDFMILGPNNYFLNYISKLLPDLDINNVEQTTFENIGLESIGSKVKLESKNITLQKVLNNAIDIEFMRYKSSLEFLYEIENFVEKYIHDNIVNPVIFDDVEICSTNILERICSKVNSNENYSKKINDLTKLMCKKIKEENEIYYSKIREKYIKQLLTLPDDSLERKELILKLKNLKQEVSKGCPNVFKEYFKFSKEKPLNIYVKFIEQLNIDDNKKKETIDRINKKELGFEDLAPILYINYLINGIEKYKGYNHLIIDEAQDLSLAQYYVLKKIFSNCTFDIYGDINQSIYDYNSIHNWNELNDKIFNNKANLNELNKSYRTTSQISDISNYVLDNIGHDLADCISRNGEEVISVNNCSTQNLINEIVSLVDDGYNDIAIICKDDNETNVVYNKLKKINKNIIKIEEKNDKYNGGICVMPSYLSKGLEFDAVILNNVDKNIYKENPIDMKLLYVSITRAMHKLIINYENDLPKALEILQKENNSKEYIKIK